MKQMYVLGTGQAVCLHYHNTCFALTDGEEYFLIDGGGGSDIIRCITRMEIPWQKIHHAYLSHEHTDHLMGMVWVVRYVAELINWHRYEGDFTVYVNAVTAEKLLTVCKLLLKKAQRDLIGPRIHIELIGDGQTVNVLGDDFTFFDIHSRKAVQYGFRMDAKEGYHLVFLGDEPFSEETVQYMEPCDWMIAESFCRYADVDRYNPYELFHSTVKEACECAKRFHAKNLIIWHTEDESTYGFRKQAYTEEAQQFFDGNIFVPDDFEIIDLVPQNRL